MVKKFGQTKEEEIAQHSQECREIVKRILEFGVTQDQILRTIYLLSLELEDRNIMVDISSIAKKYVMTLEKPTEAIIT